jgi:CheY-like chemotaxis protein
MQPEDIPRVAPPVVAIYGQESENEVLADELALDGYDVRLVSDPAMLGEVDLIVFGRTPQRGASLGALRALRQGQLAGSGTLSLWMSTSRDAIDTLRAFEAGADDVIRAPFVYAELLACARSGASPPAHRRDTSGHPLWGADDPYGHADGDLRIDARGATETRVRAPGLPRAGTDARDPQDRATAPSVGIPVAGHIADGGVPRSRLRCKLAKAGAIDWMPSTWGVGYCLAPRPQLVTRGSHEQASRAGPLRRDVQAGTRATGSRRR